MLSVSLVFVGITLFLNGLIELCNYDKKNLIVVNGFTGSIIFIFNIYQLVMRGTPQIDISSLGGLLFALTNIFIFFDVMFKIDNKPFGWFCLFASLIAVFLGIYYFTISNILLGILWFVWLLIWLFTFIGFAVTPKFKTACYYMFIIQGITSTFGIGILSLFQIITLV